MEKIKFWTETITNIVVLLSSLGGLIKINSASSSDTHHLIVWLIIILCVSLLWISKNLFKLIIWCCFTKIPIYIAYLCWKNRIPFSYKNILQIMYDNKAVAIIFVPDIERYVAIYKSTNNTLQIKKPGEMFVGKLEKLHKYGVIEKKLDCVPGADPHSNYPIFIGTQLSELERQDTIFNLDDHTKINEIINGQNNE